MADDAKLAGALSRATSPDPLERALGLADLVILRREHHADDIVKLARAIQAICEALNRHDEQAMHFLDPREID